MKKYILLPLFLMVFAINGFSIDGLIVATKDYTFMDKWSKIKSNDGPTLVGSDTIFKNQYFYIVVPFSHYDMKDDGMVDISLSIKVVKPNGKEAFSEGIADFYKHKNTPKDMVLIGDAVLKISFEDVDEFGEYKIYAKITDNISGKTKELNSKINLVELPKYSDFVVKNDKELGKWLSFYYTKLEPEKALSNFIYFTKSSIAKKNRLSLHIAEFFLEIFKNNTFLYPDILEALKNEKGYARNMLLFLISNLDIDENLFINELTKDEKESYLKFKKSPIPNPYEEIMHPMQLDMLWTNFMASGSYKPILKLIQTLDYVEYDGALKTYKNKNNKTQNDKKNALYNAIYGSLVWSLKSNMQQHKLVKQYMEWAYAHENLNDVQKRELGKILEVR
ncbi:hypothetical protein CBLAS_0551 [Campylobacter blaseri]|uniref:Uncharacterized protein n=1 Tax=Campylobacter blaseri TaxID=2042961 RepID=A0A2P8R096_9BACT|nr:hypothetical protein [Campylobacter blaseri]PSM51918.1 hypothetical protein CQ405_04960 [Campylobacter blaseri]PSM53702.1 hypothetical protein CRN67_04960 [Campylobacter blaseri]QKF85744.1 hypothetical protein CBLAS_0551 [Campylobacter blaseri]